MCVYNNYLVPIVRALLSLRLDGVMCRIFKILLLLFSLVHQEFIRITVEKSGPVKPVVRAPTARTSATYGPCQGGQLFASLLFKVW